MPTRSRWTGRNSDSSSFENPTSQRTGSAGERLQFRRHQVALPALGQSPVTGAGGRRRRFAHGLEVVGRPVAKGSAVPDGRPSACRVHRPAGRFRIPLSVFDFHERYPLSAETGGGHSIVVGSRSVRGSRKSSLHPTLVRAHGVAAAHAALAAEISAEPRLRSRFAHTIVGRGQFQRKQRLDAVGRQSVAGAGCGRRPQRRWARNSGSATRSGEPS